MIFLLPETENAHILLVDDRPENLLALEDVLDELAGDHQDHYRDGPQSGDGYGGRGCRSLGTARFFDETGMPHHAGLLFWTADVGRTV